MTIKIVGLKTCGDCRIRFNVLENFTVHTPITSCAECDRRFSFGNSSVKYGNKTMCYIEDDGDDSISRYPKVA